MTDNIEKRVKINQTSSTVAQNDPSVKQHLKPFFSWSSQLAYQASLEIPLCYTAFLLIGANDGAFGVLIPSLRMHYGVDKATIGLLFFLQSVGYLVAAFSSGLLIEKLGNRRFLMLGVVSLLFGVGALALMFPFMIVLLTMLPLGLGIGMIDAGINAYIASMPRNGARLNYLHAFYGIGALLGPLIASVILAVRWGWNNVSTSNTFPSGTNVGIPPRSLLLISWPFCAWIWVL
jgi:fucose permease